MALLGKNKAFSAPRCVWRGKTEVQTLTVSQLFRITRWQVVAAKQRLQTLSVSQLFRITRWQYGAFG